MIDHHETYRFCGSRKQLNALMDAFEAGVVSVDLDSEPTPYEPPFLESQPLGEVGLVEVLISFTISIAANATYDTIAERIKRFKKENPTVTVDKQTDE